MNHDRYRRLFGLALSAMIGCSAIFATSSLAGATPAGAIAASPARTGALSPAACTKLVGAITTFGSSPASVLALSVFGKSAGNALPKNTAQLTAFHRAMVGLAGFSTLIKSDLTGRAAFQDAQMIKTARTMSHSSIREIHTLAADRASRTKLASMAGSLEQTIANLYTSCSSA